jgi:hypothetical protein
MPAGRGACGGQDALANPTWNVDAEPLLLVQSPQLPNTEICPSCSQENTGAATSYFFPPDAFLPG